MIEDRYNPPFTVQLINNFIDRDTLNYLFNICETAKFFDGIQMQNGQRIVKPSVKIRYDYVLTRAQCSNLDHNLINKTNLGMTYRENWRIFYYDGNQKAFRGRHTDWYKDVYEYRRISMIIGLSDPKDYEGGELYFEELNLTLKLNRNSCVLFDSRMFHEVRPVTKGKRFVLQTFLFDEPGWELIKDTRVKARYSFIPPPVVPLNKTPEWEIQEGVALINPKHVIYHSEFIGKFNDYRDVLQTLNTVRNEIFAFTWFKPEYEDPNLKGRIIGWTLGRLIYHGSKGPFEVLNKDHVVSGKIKDLSKYIHSGKYLNTLESQCDDHHTEQALENETFIIPITPDSGPGNQLITIKEAMLMAKFTGRKVASPPIVQHYMTDRKKGRKGEFKLWNFSTVFETNGVVCDLNEFHLTECYSNFRISIMAEHIKCTSQFTESLVKGKENIIINKKLEKESDYDFLKSNQDRSVMISGLFNRTKFSNCCTNGCDNCDMYPLFLEDYKQICREIDFSAKIKEFGDAFILDKGLQNGFLALHIRVDDLGKESYDVDKVVEMLKQDPEIKDLPIFVATNTPKNVKSSDVIMFTEDSKYDELESFIEQYICCQSKRFYYNGGGLSRKDTGHLRSTWSSFVVDYRRYKLENMENHYLIRFMK